MENLNAEKIYKELVMFTEDMPTDLHLGFKRTIKFRKFLKKASALIKSQEQQIDALYRLVDDKIQENKRLTEENERLRTIPEQMKERLQAYFGTYVLGYKIPLTEALKAVNQITKEMV